MSQKRKFMFVYLTTGAGHISTARVMKECILKNEPNAEVVMVNGFDKKNFWGQVILEQGYYVSWTLSSCLRFSSFSFFSEFYAQIFYASYSQIPAQNN